jgi:hypothetical protein
MEWCSKQCLIAPTLRRPGSEFFALRRRSRDRLGVSRTYEAPGHDGRKEHEQCAGQKQGVITVSKNRDGAQPRAPYKRSGLFPGGKWHLYLYEPQSEPVA